jgi:3,4-dihydroxy 2-butanone 4-phosphate synthase/GTP cyclohydrolase II
VVRDDGSMMRAPELRRFADEHALVMISIAQMIEHRLRREPPVRRLAETVLPTAYGDFAMSVYASEADGQEHLTLVLGDVAEKGEVLVRAHSECLTGDVLGSLRCDCGDQLRESLRRIAAAGSGVLTYLRGHEGRGIGLAAKLAAYALQDRGRDTVAANLELGLPVDAREYGVVGQILGDLRVGSVRLLTNNPAKVAALVAAGIDVVERVPLVVPPGSANRRYLRTKRDRLGHQLPADELPADELPADELPADELPADELPADGLPGEDAELGGAWTTATAVG